MNVETAQAVLAADSGWVKSKRSKIDACVELNSVPGYVGMRDSKHGVDSPVLVFNHDEIRAFLLGAKDGEFDHFLN